MKNPDDHALQPRMSRRKFLSRTAGAAAFSALPNAAFAEPAVGHSGGSQAGSAATLLRVDTSPSHVVNSFDPDESLGSSMDELSPSIIDKIYTPEIIRECLSAGWGPITYRLHTELAIEAWHWNSDGEWSDPTKKQGYFTGNATPTGSLRNSFGYPLPRRGTTSNGGAGQGYSRLTDGDPASFWKTNPYLTETYTKEDDALHPQWIILDLAAAHKVNAIRIDWGNPYASAYEVQYWTGDDPMSWEGQYASGGGGVAQQAAGRWNRFADGKVTDGSGGRVTLKVSWSPVATRWIRVVMTKSACGPQPSATGDPRDRLGYAIHQVYAGTIQHDGTFIDLVKHAPDASQTATYCSSTDPWHSASDLSPSRSQTGFDLFFTCGITNKLPAIVPVAVLYSIPEDAAAQISYLKTRGYSIGWVEMGEECDGQYYMPEDYAALYLQFADAIHKVDPGIKLGGPVFQGINQDISVWPDAQGRTSWFGRFLDYLKAHGRIQDLTFVSFEHYPFDPCSVNWADLYREPELTRSCLQALRDDGLPDGVPLMNTESNVSWEMTPYMSDIFSGLWLADSVGSFFLEGGGAYFHSPIQPQAPNRGCRGWGTWSNFVCDSNFKIKGYTAEYNASHLINLEWASHHSGVHHMFRVLGTVQDASGNALITSYALQRPDGDWSILLINKDKSNPRTIQVVFEDSESGQRSHFADQVQMVTFGSEQYVWHSTGPDSHADPDDPPRRATVPGGPEARFTLPKASVTVLRGKIEARERQ
ncbi:MAG TPA: discoidin domain-containing protein [Terriglobia bacterium]|nr:discoidin domain-containing protein [Terriglobia bacterium]